MENIEQKIFEEHKKDLRNEEIIEKILLKGNSKDLEELREFHKWSPEEIKLFRNFAKLRAETHEKMGENLKERVLNNPEPTKEEESLCVYKEEIEPQVLDAVMLMRKKGYDTYESGFYGSNKQRIGFNEDYLEKFELPEEAIESAKEKRIEIKIESDAIEFFCNEYLDLEKMKEFWDKISQAMPDLDKPAEVRSDEASKSFKKRIENMKNNPDKILS